uniref:CCHC-type domain-containing protein n=1 Tax=Tanacetum cinerariifolium TaxID=118510 RepID=A0A6L2M9W7_TANCI|nr:hypothetical protein [Tanacetum cinerariifolium]
MQADQLLCHKVEGRVEEVEELVIKMVKEVAEGGAIVYTHWIEKIESIQDMSGCRDNQKVKYIGDSFIDFKALMREEFCPNNEMQKLETEFWCHTMVELAMPCTLIDYMSLLATEPTTYHIVILKARMLTNEAIRKGSLKKNTKKRGNGWEPGRDGNVKDDNKRSRTGRAFATANNPVRKEHTVMIPKCINCNYHHLAERPCCMCMNDNRFGHFARDCRVGPGMVNPVNAKNPIAACGSCFECGGHGNNGEQAHGRAFMLGAEEARQDQSGTYEEYKLNNAVTRDLKGPWLDNEYDELADGKLKEETLMHKEKIEESWGNVTPNVMKLCPWLINSFGNFHELDYNVLVKLQECWWKINAHEVAPFTCLESYGQRTYANIKTKKAHDPYLEVNNIFSRNYKTSNAQDNQGHKERMADPTLEPSICKIRRFEMMKY